MKLVFYKRTFAWPLRAGADVHAGNLMRALAAHGHEVVLLAREPVDQEACQWLSGVQTQVVTDTSSEDAELGKWAARFASYWGEDALGLAATVAAVHALQPDALVAVGPENLPLLSSCAGPKRVWYVADDPVLHQFSTKGLRNPRTLLTMIAYQRLLPMAAEATWVVTERDRKWSRRIGGQRATFIPNGVDLQAYRPLSIPVRRKTCMFWGRLDFAPNIDAVRFFLEKVWPLVHAAQPDATFVVCGSGASRSFSQQLEATAGVEYHENLPDLRQTIAQAEIAVFPLVSGAGVKNKLLEGAAMGKPIIATSRCKLGLCGDDLPLVICDHPQAWKTEILRLWADNTLAQSLLAATREWVEQNHRWSRSADLAIASLQ